MTKPQVPLVGDVVGRGIEALVAKRPSAAPHVEDGHYGNVVEGWRAQFELARVRLVDEVAASRRVSAKGAALTELAASEYEVARRVEPLAAIGEVTIARVVVHYVKDSANAVATADSSDEATAVALVNAQVAAYNLHRLSVWNASLGTGAHVSTVGAAISSVGGSPTMTQLVGKANEVRTAYRAHALGAPPHVSTDSTNALPSSGDAFVDLTGADNYGGATNASRQSLHSALRTLKAKWNAHVATEAKPGAIRRGHRFQLVGEPTSTPPVPTALLEAVLDTSVATGSLVANIAVRSVEVGSDVNLPVWFPPRPYTVRSLDPFYDGAATYPWAPNGAVLLAGGAGAQTDPELDAACAANYVGRYGPTVGALVAGALVEHGAFRAVVREDSANARVRIFATDASWAQSFYWLNQLTTKLARVDGWLGWGCRQTVGYVYNQRVRVEIDVFLRSDEFLVDTETISQRIQRRLLAYFDDRPDWYVWKNQGIRGAVIAADRRILTATNVVVRDENDVPLFEPVAPAMTQTFLTHYWLADNAVVCNFKVTT